MAASAEKDNSHLPFRIRLDFGLGKQKEALFRIIRKSCLSFLKPKIKKMTHLFEGDVKKNLLERSEAEKVFRPWWDTLEDYLLNILIVIGQWSVINLF